MTVVDARKRLKFQRSHYCRLLSLYPLFPCQTGFGLNSLFQNRARWDSGGVLSIFQILFDKTAGICSICYYNDLKMG